MRRIVFVICVVVSVSLFICNIGLCRNGTQKIQYKDYVWGTKKSEVKKLIIDDGYEVKKKYKNDLEYNEYIFSSKVNIELLFTPKSNRLYHICIIDVEDENRDFYKKLKKTYNKKYGSNSKEGKDLCWIKNNRRVCLKECTFLSGFELHYVSDKYRSLYVKEHMDKL